MATQPNHGLAKNYLLAMGAGGYDSFADILLNGKHNIQQVFPRVCLAEDCWIEAAGGRRFCRSHLECRLDQVHTPGAMSCRCIHCRKKAKTYAIFGLAEHAKTLEAKLAEFRSLGSYDRLAHAVSFLEIHESANELGLSDSE